MLSLIVAFSKNKVIGNKGEIPWKIKGEQIRFKELTTGNAIVMGRKTFEEIGKPLSGRKTYLLSSHPIEESEDLIKVNSLEEVIELEKEKDIFVSGGARIYQEAIDKVDRMYITEIDAEFEGDTFFPEYNENDWMVVYKEKFGGEIPYTYITLERKSSFRKQVTEWKDTFDQYKQHIESDKKSIDEVVDFLHKKYGMEEIIEIVEEKRLSLIIKMLQENAFYKQKIPENVCLIPRGYEISTKNGKTFIGMEEVTKQVFVEGNRKIAEEIIRFQGLDEYDLQNYYVVSEYVRCTENR